MSRIQVAESAGFCFGVKRAIDMAYAELAKAQERPLYSYGPLIHNKEVTGDLEKKGLHIIESPEEAGDGAVIIRSHGVGREIYERLEKNGAEIVDGTCPFVQKIHNIVREEWEQGKTIIIVGDGKHPEVVGINGWCGNSALILGGPEDADTLPLSDGEDYALVVQTTFRQSKLDTMLDILEKRGIHPKVYRTICSAKDQAAGDERGRYNQ